MNVISPAKLRELASHYGTPLFVVSEQYLRDRGRRFLTAFGARLENTIVGYSYKTNNLAGICAILHREGLWAEVVSGLEYALAHRLGLTGDRIVFNGPHKGAAQIVSAILEGALVNIDSESEIPALLQAAETSQKPTRFGIRLSLEIGPLPWSRFGFVVEGDQALSFIRSIHGDKRLSLCGLHIHLGTNIAHPGMYLAATQNALAFASRLSTDLGIDIEYLDLGGGFPYPEAKPKTVYASHGLRELKPEDWSPAPLEAYADAICSPIAEWQHKRGKPLTLIIEPGRAIVAPCVLLLARVVSVKKRRNSLSITINAGQNVLPSASYLHHRVTNITSDLDADDCIADVYGPLCSQFDIVAEQVTLARPSVGDLLLVADTGAYNLTGSSQFSFPRPAVVLLSPEGTEDIIRPAENYDDVIGKDIVPARLQGRPPTI